MTGPTGDCPRVMRLFVFGREASRISGIVSIGSACFMLREYEGFPLAVSPGSKTKPSWPKTQPAHPSFLLSRPPTPNSPPSTPISPSSAPHSPS